MMIKFLFIMNMHGKVRVSKYYEHYPESGRRRLETDLIKACLTREGTQSTIYEYEDYTVVYRRYGYLFLIAGISSDENELAILELFHNILETIKAYLGTISEVQIVFNFDKIHIILDEMIMNGVIAETSQARIIAPLKLMASSKT